jgi:hypothetical protein
VLHWIEISSVLTGKMTARRRVVIMGAAGFDYHVFNRVFRNDGMSNVVAFSAAAEQNYKRGACLLVIRCCSF